MSSSTARTRELPRSSSLVLAIAVVLAACTPVATNPNATSTDTPLGSALAADRIQILHTNDIHGRMDSEMVRSGAQTYQQGGMALMAGMAAKLRERAPDRTLLLDAGDVWEGTLLTTADKGASLTRVMSLMRYDAMAVGNHDLDYGQDAIAQRAKEATFPFLAANLVDASGAPPPWAKPYVIKDLGIAKVAILGLTYPQINTKGSNFTGLRLLKAIDTAKRYVPQLRAQADVVVALTHLGIQARFPWDEPDVDLAAAVPDIDVIVGGHSHTTLRSARVVGNTTIVQTGSDAMNLGHLELTIDRATKKVTAVARVDELLAVSSGFAKPDPEVAAIVDADRKQAEKVTARVVGSTAMPLQQDRNPDTPLGNLVADAILEYGRTQGWGTELAFYNGAGLRADLPAGTITYGALFTVLPFQNVVTSVDLSGEQVRGVLEDASGNAGRLHPAGVTWTYRFENQPNQRVLSASVGGRPLEATRTYHVATIDFLLYGGDGHTGFAKGTNVIYGDFDVDAVAAYIAAHSPVDPRPDGRVVQVR